MNEYKRDGSGFVGYEYLEVTVSEEKRSMYLDGYESFGWQLDDNYIDQQTGKGKLHLRRDRRILNKMELTRLQRNFEACMKDLDSLEDSKTSMPTIVALTVGLSGTACIAGSVFAVTADPPIIWLCILLAIPGFIGCGLPCILYKKLVQKRTGIVAPLIEDKYDEIYEICKKGNNLLK